MTMDYTSTVSVVVAVFSTILASTRAQSLTEINSFSLTNVLHVFLYLEIGQGVYWTSVFLWKFYTVRSGMKGLPGPPYHPIFGHILVAVKMSKVLPGDANPHHQFYWLRKEYNLGPFFYFDVWPIAPPTLIICDADVADQVTLATPTLRYSLDKHPLIMKYLALLLGQDNLAAINGDKWKKTRAIYNPGFAPVHLIASVPKIVDEVETFIKVLGKYADNKKKLELEAISTKLSFDVIGRLVLDVELNSQRADHGLVEAFRRHTAFLVTAQSWMGPLTALITSQNKAINNNSDIIDGYLGGILDGRLKMSAEERSKSHCMLDVALRTYNTEVIKTESFAMDPTFRQLTIDQIRTFVFAGHDTISTTIAMIFYYLSSNLLASKALLQELDKTFGTLPPGDRIRQEPHIINDLPYTTAIIKETLRLFPPGNTVRVGSPELSITADGLTCPTLPVPNTLIWPCSWTIGRNEKYFPDPNSFRPERWIVELSPWPLPPAGAYRAFERGPRNCIGSEFSMLEMKVAVVMAVPLFDFEPVFADDAPSIDGEKCYQIIMGSSKPKGGVPGYIHRSERGIKIRG